MKKHKLVIAAGTGFLGQVLTAYFKADFTEIVILTRGKAFKKDNIRYVHWDAKTLGDWVPELENADCLINLAGKSVDCRYTTKNKAEILASRIDSTAVLNLAVLQCAFPPKHWLNSSTATIYVHSEQRQMAEENGETGHDFSMTVARKWEAAFFGTPTPTTLKTALRTSIVLGRHGGAYVPLRRLAKAGFGGMQGNGSQFVSWIHELDFARALAFIMERKLTGCVNVVAPNPIRNKAFMSALRKNLHLPIGLPVPTWLLKMGAALIGTETELVLKSRNVVPKKLSDAGFDFTFANAEKALADLAQNEKR